MGLPDAVLTRSTRLLIRGLAGRKQPFTDGSLRVHGLHGPVTVRRDGYGVPYIDAQDDHDAWFALGFCQAQDRAFQLELRLRTQRGTLSQLFGEATLAVDRLARRVGFVESARRQLPVLDDDIVGQIEAYARGINAGLGPGRGGSAPEFGLLRARPTPWEAVDVVGFGKLLSFLLIGNWDVELSRLKILIEDGPEALRDLDPTPYPDDHVVAAPPATAAGLVLDRLGADLERFLEFSDFSGGSNAWALSGARTRSGRALLANDPHLEAAMPPHWYLARIRTPEWSLAGASMIGTPAMATAHNGHVAWGITAGLVDTVDLFLEEVGADRRSVRQGDGFVACEVRQEVIEVRGKAPAVEEVLVTPRGPVISPALDGDFPAISVRALWLDARPGRGFLALQRVRDFESFREQFAQWPVLNQNVVYADSAGSIGWLLAGDAPRRKAGWGTLPLSGADPEAGWYEEGVPFSEMPFVLNPEPGFVASANNKPFADGAGPYLGVDWLDGYRAARIVEALEARGDWDVASTFRLQLDETSLPWREIRELVLGLRRASVRPEPAGVESAHRELAGPELVRPEPAEDLPASDQPSQPQTALMQPVSVPGGPTGPRPDPHVAVGEAYERDLALAIDLLEAWDGRVAASSAAAAIYELFLREMARRVAQARAPNSAAWALGRGFNDLLFSSTFAAGRQSRLLRRLREQPEGWFARGWQAEMRDALVAVVEELRQRFGPEAARWSWGRVRSVTLMHPLGRVKALAPIFNRGPFAWGGDGNTVSQASGYGPSIIASLRAVIPLGDWDEARFVLPGGQSGNPFSRHYDDQLPLWQRGEGIAIAWSEAAVQRAAVSRLHLGPLRAAASG